MLDGSNVKAFLYLQYWKAGKKNHAAVCEYRDKAEGSNIGEIPWKWFVSEDQYFFILEDAVLMEIFSWTGSGTTGHVRVLYRCWSASVEMEDQRRS